MAGSYWAATAPPPPEVPALEGDVEHDIAIVGAGFTGLSAAHHLAKAGADCIVLEAEDAGWGASGRNGGMAVTRYKKGWAALAAKYGTPTTLQLHAMIHEALDSLEATVAEHGIECGFKRCGHLTPAHGREALTSLEADVAWLEREARDSVPKMLDRGSAARELGTDAYLGAYLDERAAGIHPLAYARGLAAALAVRGLPIRVRTPVEAMRQDGARLVLETPRGRVRARRVLLATNAYTDRARIHADLHRRIVPVSTSVVATAPLSDNLARTILPTGRLASDTKRIMNYFRLLPDRRLLLGGRGDLLGRDHPESYRGLEQAIGRLFPQIAEPKVEHRWSGQVAVTMDDFPHIGRLAENVFFAMGYGGRGVALTALLGKYLARLATDHSVDAGPMSTKPFAPVPFHRLRVPGMQLVASYYRYRDRIEQTRG